MVVDSLSKVDITRNGLAIDVEQGGAENRNRIVAFQFEADVLGRVGEAYVFAMSARRLSGIHPL